MQQLSPSDLEDKLKDYMNDSSIRRHKSVGAVTTGTDDNSANSPYWQPPPDTTYPTKGGAQLSIHIRKQLKQRGRAGSHNPHLPAQASQMDDNGDGGEGDHMSSMLPPLGPGWVLLEHCKTHWNWNIFFYNLILDLAPAAWDVITDIFFAKYLETMDIHRAGLSYMFICVPIIYLAVERVAKISKISKIKMICNIIAFPAVCTVLACCLWADPLMFRPLAILSSAMFLCLKSVAVLVHSPEMAQFSLHLSQVESATEAPLQVQLILYTWIYDGHLPWDTLLSSLLDIGKVATEKFLTAGPKDLLKGQPFLEKLVLFLKYLPVFLLTAFFRSGAIAVIQGLFRPFSPSVGLFLTCFYVTIHSIIYQVWFGLLRVHVLPGLQQLDYMDLCHAVVSEQFSVTSMWGGLGRRGSRAPQMILATWFLLHNLVYISLILESTFTQVVGRW